MIITIIMGIDTMVKNKKNIMLDRQLDQAIYGIFAITHLISI